jgi:DHA2 family multidrug resistance protein
MVFYINLIPGSVMLAAVFFAIDPEPLNLPLLWKGDWLGTVFMAIGLGSLIAFLEEGQNDDWFTSVFIQRSFALAVIFIPLFIICELVSKSPVTTGPKFRLGFGGKFFDGRSLIRFRVSYTGIS